MNTTRVTITEAAQILGRKPDTIRKWLQEGCPHEKEEGAARLSIAKVFKWRTSQVLALPPEPTKPRFIEERIMLKLATIEAQVLAFRASIEESIINTTIPDNLTERLTESAFKATEDALAKAFPKQEDQDSPVSFEERRPLIRRLLELQIKESDWADRVSTPEELEIRCPIAGNLLLLGLVLDLFGVPRDPDDWDEYLRQNPDFSITEDDTPFQDSYTNLWFEMVREKGDLDGFMEKLPWP